MQAGGIQTGVIQERLDRIRFYFPDDNLREIITDGISNKPAGQISIAEERSGLAEGGLGHKVLKRVTDETHPLPARESTLSQYIAQIKQIEVSQKFFWEVDAGGVNDRQEKYPSIAGRLAHRLIESARSETFADKLSPGSKQQIAELYAQFKESIDSRTARHDRDTKEFNTIFAAPQYADVRKTVLQPKDATDEPGHLTTKYCGTHLFEIQDFAKKIASIQIYFEGLTAAKATSKLATKLVSEFEKNMKNYSKRFDHELPADIREECERCIAQFKAAV